MTDESVSQGMTVAKTYGLLPCPFCGAGTFDIVRNGKVWTGIRWSTPSSVSVRHWCVPLEGQPHRMIERVGKDLDSVIAAWNMRFKEE